MTPEALKAYYKAHFVGSRVVVVGAGMQSILNELTF